MRKKTSQIKVIKIKPEIIDERGFITKIIDQNKYNIKSILYIFRKKSSIGANHFHKKDYHFIYVLSGKIRYFEKDMHEKDAPLESVILNPGDLVLTLPAKAHATEILEEGVHLAFSTENRDSKSYEKDTIRIKLI